MPTFSTSHCEVFGCLCQELSLVGNPAVQRVLLSQRLARTMLSQAVCILQRRLPERLTWLSHWLMRVVRMTGALANLHPMVTNAALGVPRNLECLEATFYSYAAYGSGLNSTLRGDGPVAIGGKKAMLSSAVQNYANEVARDEINHVSVTSSKGALV